MIPGLTGDNGPTGISAVRHGGELRDDDSDRIVLLFNERLGLPTTP